MALQGLIERTLGDVREDLILSFICGAVRDSGKEKTNIVNIICNHNQSAGHKCSHGDK